MTPKTGFGAVGVVRSEVKKAKEVKPIGKVMKVKQHVPDSLMTKKPVSGVIV